MKMPPKIGLEKIGCQHILLNSKERILSEMWPWSLPVARTVGVKERILDEDKETIEKLNKLLASVIPEGTAANNKKWNAKNE